MRTLWFTCLCLLGAGLASPLCAQQPVWRTREPADGVALGRPLPLPAPGVLPTSVGGAGDVRPATLDAGPGVIVRAQYADTPVLVTSKSVTINVVPPPVERAFESFNDSKLPAPLAIGVVPPPTERPLE